MIVSYVLEIQTVKKFRKFATPHKFDISMRQGVALAMASIHKYVGPEMGVKFLPLTIASLQRLSHSKEEEIWGVFLKNFCRK